MPLIKTKYWGNNHSMAVWLINESAEQLQSSLGENHRVPADIKNREKQLEWLAARNCVKHLCESMGLKYYGITKDTNSKPILINHESIELSISHSYPNVAAIISNKHVVGIDIEQARPKLLGLSSRFMADEELLYADNDIKKICLYWCAKETLYKYYSMGNITFKKQLIIEPFDFKDEGQIIGNIFTSNKNFRITMNYEIKDAYVLCYTAPCPADS